MDIDKTKEAFKKKFYLLLVILNPVTAKSEFHDLWRLKEKKVKIWFLKTEDFLTFSSYEYLFHLNYLIFKFYIGIQFLIRYHVIKLINFISDSFNFCFTYT